ncbi:hypothetical protein [Tabrizicola sp. M-4]|uniref:hypothetical protein n=1 Tax=Tabrizicola sp. M-4 TaxID=3055847 RepID=UPI003DA90A1B
MTYDNDMIRRGDALAIIAAQMKDSRRTYKGFGHAQEALRFAEQMLAAAFADIATPARPAGADAELVQATPIDAVKARIEALIAERDEAIEASVSNWRAAKRYVDKIVEVDAARAKAEAERDAAVDALGVAQEEAAEAAKLASWCREAFKDKLTEAEIYQLQRVWEFADCAARLKGAAK